MSGDNGSVCHHCANHNRYNNPFEEETKIARLEMAMFANKNSNFKLRQAAQQMCTSVRRFVYFFLID